MEEIIKYINKYFYKEGEKNDFTIEEGRLKADFKLKYLKGLYIQIEGSLLNDGIYEIKDVNDGLVIEGLEDEEFEGVVIIMAIPKDLKVLAKEIAEYKEKNKTSAYISENIGAYSYTKATDKDGKVITWQLAFKDSLKKYKNLTSKESQRRWVKIC